MINRYVFKGRAEVAVYSNELDVTFMPFAVGFDTSADEYSPVELDVGSVTHLHTKLGEWLAKQPCKT